MPRRRLRRTGYRSARAAATAAEFKPVAPGALDDLSLLPRRFELHREEVRTSFELLGTRIESLGERIERKLDTLLDRAERTERRVDALEADNAAAHAVNGASGD